MATAKKRNAKNKDAIIAAEIGAAVVAAGVAAAAGYYFYGARDAKKHRAAASKWARGMKAEVVREAKKAKKLDKKTVTTIVDAVAAAYMGARAIDPAQLKAAARELKTNWRELEREIGSAGKTAKKAAKGATKKATKTVKKATKKAA